MQSFQKPIAASAMNGCVHTSATGAQAPALKNRFEALPFVRSGCAWAPVPAGLHPSEQPQSPARRFDIGVLHARALLRFYFLESAVTARCLACAGHQLPDCWPSGFLAQIVGTALSPGHPLPDEFAGFLDEIERWLVHAAGAQSVLMDAPAVLGPLTLDEWRRQWAACIEGGAVVDDKNPIWPPAVWPSYVASDALRPSVSDQDGAAT